jgi:hypothetical protein
MSKGSSGEPDHALSLSEALEREFCALSGEDPRGAVPRDWRFEASQILAPVELRERLLKPHDPAARGLAEKELRELVRALERNEGEAPAAIGQRIADALNGLLDSPSLYQDGAARFAGARFRSQTRERLASKSSSLAERNRLVLEDVFPELERCEDARLAQVLRKAHRHKFAALCLSGGGIRSAAFALGIVQGLARLGLLKRFDYLSTVSGGGYLGGWLSAWMHRAGPEQVIADLTERTRRPLAPEPATVSHLRTYSSFMSPRVGLMSVDTWTLAATMLRNLMLNWLVLIPLLAAALGLPQLFIAVTRLPHDAFSDIRGIFLADMFFPVLLLIGFGAATTSIHYVHAGRKKGEPARAKGATRDHRRFMRRCFAPLLLAVVAWTIAWSWLSAQKVGLLWGTFPEELSQVHWAWLWASAGAALHFAGWLAATKGRAWRELGVVLATGAIGGVAAGWVARALVPSAPEQTFALLEQYAWYVSLAVPAVLAIVLGLSHLYIGITSRTQTDGAFEWTARYGAWLQIAIFVWLATFGIVVLAPIGFAWVVEKLSDPPGLVASAAMAAALAGLVAGMITLRLGYRGAPANPAARAPSPRASLAQALAPSVFVVVFMALLSYFVGWLMDIPQRLHPRWFTDWSCPMLDREDFHNQTLQWLMCGSVPAAAVVFVALGLGGLLLSTRIDTNRLSLHGMYRTRLIRAFLGASRAPQNRDPDRFTGLDEDDDLPLANLWHPERRAPFHVVNAALNLVADDGLAAQYRKAESFTFTPLTSGAARQGYRATREYGGGVTLGTAITISGAAASPEMGYHSKPLYSFLLTLCNVRLGWWLGNPGFAGRANFRRAAPASSVLPLIDEALGRTDERNPNVYLSDGGHFENLGLYEMVMRRCRWIVVSDAGCDPDGAFEDLGNAIRRIRVDFGIPIQFTSIPIYGRYDERAAKPGATYCAIGRIRYSEVDGAGAEDGTLVYIKASYYGCEPPDVCNYAHTSSAFPHESTANQFFTEAQFESYRCLGAHIVEHIAGFRAGVPGAPDPHELSPAEFIARVRLHVRTDAPSGAVFPAPQFDDRAPAVDAPERLVLGE